MKTFIWVIYIIHSWGNEPVGYFEDKLECQIERANLIEARRFKSEYVVCRKTEVIETTYGN